MDEKKVYCVALYYTHIKNGANGASNADQLDVSSLEPSVSRISILVAVGRQGDADVVERFCAVGDGVSALGFTTIAGFSFFLAGICREDAGRCHREELCMFARL